MKLIAHRGFADEFPENTLQAFQQAASDAEMIELDLRRCRSDELVVIHDGIVDAVTSSSGRVGALTATELERLDVLDSGEGVPTFAAVLEKLPTDVAFNIELKEHDLVPDVVAALDGKENEVVISSSSTDVLEEVKRVDQSVDTALIFSTAPDKNLKRARVLGCQYIQPHWGVCVATDLVRQAHELGMGVFVWSITSNLGASILRFVDADGVIADRPVRPLQYEVPRSSSTWVSQRFQRPEIGVRLTYQILRILAFITVILLIGQLVKIQNWTISRLRVVDRVSGNPVLSSAIVLLANSLLFAGWKLRAVGTDSSGRWRGGQELSMSIHRLRLRVRRFITSTRVARSAIIVRSVHLLLTLGMLLSYIVLVVGWHLLGVVWGVLQSVVRTSTSYVKHTAPRLLA